MTRSIHCPSCWLLLVALFAVVPTGCTPPIAADEETAENRIVVPPGPPSELVKIIEQSTVEAMDIADQLASGVNRTLRLAALERQLLTGIAAAENLSVHDESNAEKRRAGKRSKMELLAFGLEKGVPGFDERIAGYIDELKKENPASQSAAVAAALLVQHQHLTETATVDAVMPVLSQYAEEYSFSGVGLHLFSTYAERLRRDGDTENAMEVLKTAISFYPSHPEAIAIRNQLSKIREARLAEQRERAAVAADLASIKRKLGGVEEGYFVLYIEEIVRPPAPGETVWYRYNYEVIQGMDSSLAYIDRLRDQWDWKLVKRYPETEIGKNQAYAMKNRLLKQHKTQTIHPQ